MSGLGNIRDSDMDDAPHSPYKAFYDEFHSRRLAERVAFQEECVRSQSEFKAKVKSAGGLSNYISDQVFGQTGMLEAIRRRNG